MEILVTRKLRFNEDLNYHLKIPFIILSTII